MIIGTAGHIDHGKSTLVTALTGTPMDRLREERQRGITIELNFASLRLEGIAPIGIVDVPGHEDFVRTMVAGASGIDLVLLVIDAGEGIRPQTLEHLTVVEQLGVPRGIPVLTKVDLVDADWLALVRAEVEDRLSVSPVSFGTPVEVSAVTGIGLDVLRGRIAEEAARPSPRPPEDLFRLPVDRTFSLAGVGTVVTGTVWSGSLSIGDAVTLLPGGAQGKVRSIESFGQPTTTASPGARAALGLGGISREQAPRGTVVVAGRWPWTATRAVDVVITLSADAPAPLTRRSRVRVHHGTAEVMARVYPREDILPGGRGPARLALEEPLVVRGSDRLVLRRFSPVVTIGGGMVIDPSPPHRSRWPVELLDPDPLRQLVGLIYRRPSGVTADGAVILSGISSDTIGAALEAMPELLTVGDRWILRSRFDSAGRKLVGLVEEYHLAHPALPGISLETLRSQLAATGWVVDALVARFEADGHLRRDRGAIVRSGFSPSAGGGEGEVTRVVEAIRAAGLEPPTTSELGGLGLTDLAGALRMAASRGLIEAVEWDRHYARETLDRVTAVLRDVGAQGEIVPAAVREQLGLSRRFLIPLLEWADRTGVTRRGAEGRRTLA